MISVFFGGRNISFLVAPSAIHAFFKQADFPGLVRATILLQRARLPAQRLHFHRWFAPPVSGQRRLPASQEILRPNVVEALSDAFLAANLSDLSPPREPSHNRILSQPKSAAVSQCGFRAHRSAARRVVLGQRVLGVSSSFLRHCDETKTLL